jgi:hypothetical protein
MKRVKLKTPAWLPAKHVHRICGITFLLLAVLLVKAEQISHDGAVTTSIVRLLANPEAYNGKKVDVVGYYKWRYEGSGLYLSREAGEMGNASLGIWVDVPQTNSVDGRIEFVASGFVEVQGMFRYSTNGSGHLGQWPAKIDALERFNLLPLELSYQIPKRENRSKIYLVAAALFLIGIVIWSLQRRSSTRWPKEKPASN